MIRGEKTYLRPVTSEDLAIVMLWENDPEFWEVSEHTGPLSKEMIQEFISNSEDLNRSGQIRFIIQNEAHEPIGALDLFDYDQHLKTAGIGILIADKINRNRGYASDALSAFLKYQKKVRQVILIRCLIHSKNEASISLFSSHGFHKTGLKYFKGREAIQFICEL